MTEPPARAWGRRERGTYRSMLYLVARAVAFPHGYTLLIWATTMITVEQRGLPTTASIFAMLIGASTAYIGLGRIGVAGFSRISARHAQMESARPAAEPDHTEDGAPVGPASSQGPVSSQSAVPPQSAASSQGPRIISQPYLVASMNFATLFLATGACAAVSRIPWTLAAWFAVGLTGTGVYLWGIVVQNQVLGRLLRARGRSS